MTKKKKSGWITTLFIIAFMVLGIGLMLYPTVSDKWNAMHQSRAIEGYANTVAGIPEADYTQIIEDARAYNESLLNKIDRFRPTEEDSALYNSLLSFSSNGIMAYIEIPDIDVRLPIYHGTDETVIQVGVGHMEGSSLPIGGESTHSVLSSHRGLPSAQLFTHLNELKVGQKFYIHFLKEILTYQIDQIEVVLPEDTSLLEITEGEDYCTLVTCTPYGVNTHRLLVRGTRIPTEIEEDPETEAPIAPSTTEPQDNGLMPLYLFVPLILLAFVFIIVFRKKAKKKH